MDFEQALKFELSSIDGLKDKIFPLHAPEEIQEPYIVYKSTEGIEEQYLSGYQGSKEVNCELHIIAESYGEVKALTKNILTVIKSFQSRIIGDEILVTEITYSDSQESYIPDLLLYLCVLPFKVRIWVQEGF